jgi:hypothetical protein
MLLWFAHQADRQLVYMEFQTFVNCHVCVSYRLCWTSFLTLLLPLLAVKKTPHIYTSPPPQFLPVFDSLELALVHHKLLQDVVVRGVVHQQAVQAKYTPSVTPLTSGCSKVLLCLSDPVHQWQWFQSESRSSIVPQYGTGYRLFLHTLI